MTEKHFHKVGEFLVENNIITPEQLEEALILQKDNPNLLIGHVLITTGAVTKEQMIMAFEMYLVMTGMTSSRADEWLDQEEIDAIIQNLKNQQQFQV